MNRRNIFGWIGCTALLAPLAQPEARIDTYDSLAAWTAGPGGPAACTVTFAVFAADTPFFAAAVGLPCGMTIFQEGPGAFRNIIDVPALAYADNNGTSNASCFVNHEEGMVPPTKVCIHLGTHVCAWGAEFWGATTGEKMQVEFYSPAGVLLDTVEASGADGEFIGFIGAIGEVSLVKLSAVNLTPGSAGEGFGMDNLRIKINCPPPPVVCWPNCDGSSVPPILNVLDFNCFLNRYAAGDTWANCDNSTLPPVLNVLDFNCFLNRYAAGCP